jgi:hypothetical protein
MAGRTFRRTPDRMRSSPMPDSGLALEKVQAFQLKNSAPPRLFSCAGYAKLCVPVRTRYPAITELVLPGEYQGAAGLSFSPGSSNTSFAPPVAVAPGLKRALWQDRLALPERCALMRKLPWRSVQAPGIVAVPSVATDRPGRPAARAVLFRLERPCFPYHPRGVPKAIQNLLAGAGR